MSTGAVRENQTADSAQQGGGLKENLSSAKEYKVKLDSAQDAGGGQISPNEMHRGKQG